MPTRLATDADLTQILSIVNDDIARTSANFHTRPRSLDEVKEAWNETLDRYPWVVVCPENDEHLVVGFARASRWKVRDAYDWTAEVSLYIAPAHHRKGLGTELYEHLFRILEEQGHRLLIAGITLPNDASVAIHERLGFTHVGTLSGVGWKHDHWHDVGYWQKKIGHEGPPTPILPISRIVEGQG